MSIDPTTAQLSRRRFVQGSLMAALLGGTALATSSCSTSTAAGGGGGAKTLSFLSWDTQTVMQPVLDLFKQQTGFDVSASYAPPVAQYVSTLQTRLQSGTAPDVFILTAEDKQIVPGGFVKDLSGQSSLSVMNSANKDFMTVDGKVYGLSISSWAGGIMYNKALLAKVGASSLPDSWDGFLELCAALKAKGITPYYDAAKEGNFMSLWGLLGGYFADHGGFPDQDIFAGKTTFADTWTEPFVAYCKLYTQGLTPQSILGLTGDQVVSEFANSRVAMFGAGTWNVPTVQKSAPDLSFDTGAIPGFNKGTTYWTGAASPGFAVNAKAKNPEAALKFLEFMASLDGAKVYGTSSGAITTTSNYTPTVPAALTNQAAGARSGKIYLPVVAWPRHSNDLNTELTTQLQQMIQGSVKPQDIPAALDKKLKQLDGK
ncbi:ABC transporter substrate-binding protein [Kitasatospora azatica]|uniref:ABC transporter substrate-binding protein n=1 Tax=Kitasatospora azatica TaxID=58347 RepID=UPI000566EFE1|nr:extracellular solute-binding protein [Kitasatospora azatica]